MGTDPTMTGFDFAAFRTAFEAKDVATWLSFYAEDADWVEFRHDAPPHVPHRKRGHAQISRFLARVAAADIDLVVADEVVGSRRVAFAVTAILPGRRRVYEHVILHLRGGRIARQVDVETWD
jgi:ketosteroid isomerase-like protein